MYFFIIGVMNNGNTSQYKVITITPHTQFRTNNNPAPIKKSIIHPIQSRMPVNESKTIGRIVDEARVPIAQYECKNEAITNIDNPKTDNHIFSSFSGR